MWTYNYSSELYHHGILGMRWGVRRYQNKDGSLTKAGRERYSDGDGQTKQELKPLTRLDESNLSSRRTPRKPSSIKIKQTILKRLSMILKRMVSTVNILKIDMDRLQIMRHYSC